MCQNQSLLSSLDIPAQRQAQQQKYIFLSKSNSVEPAQRTLILTCICILTVELECRVGSTDIDRNICISIFNVEPAVELEY